MFDSRWCIPIRVLIGTKMRYYFHKIYIYFSILYCTFNHTLHNSIPAFTMPKKPNFILISELLFFSPHLMSLQFLPRLFAASVIFQQVSMTIWRHSSLHKWSNDGALLSLLLQKANDQCRYLLMRNSKYQMLHKSLFPYICIKTESKSRSWTTAALVNTA